MVPIFYVRTPNSFTLGGVPGSVTSIKRGDEDIVKLEGETGHVVMSEYMDIFEYAVAELERSLELSRTESRMYRVFLSGVGAGIASLEAYINYRAGQRFSYSKQNQVLFDTKVDGWIPAITGGKLDKGGVNWNHYDQLREIRNDFQTHPSTHVYGTNFSEICRRMNLFQTGIVGLLFDLHVAFNDLVPAQVIHGYFLPEIQYVIEPQYS